MSQGTLIINGVKFQLPERIEAKDGDCVVTDRDEDGILLLVKVNGMHSLVSNIARDVIPKGSRVYNVRTIGSLGN